MIKLDYKIDKPLHEQITQGIKDLIMCGVFKKDEQLPSVRDLSINLTVNPNTVQRAYKNLEIDGFIYSIRGKGNFVASIPKVNEEVIESLYNSFKDKVRELAFYKEKKEDIISVINKIFEETEE